MGDDFPRVRLAAVQAAPYLFDRDRTVELACSLIEEAGRDGAQLVGFPENFVPGHPYWHQFYNAYDPISRHFAVEFFKNAVEVPGDHVVALGEAARRAGTWVVIGVAEKEPGTLGTVYNTQLFLDPDGALVGRHRKLVLTNAERLVQHHGDASTLRTVPTPFGRIGGLICGEHFNGLARAALLLEHEVVHVAAWPAFGARFGRDQYDSMDLRVRYTAAEGQMHVVSSASIWTDQMKDALELDDEARTMFTTAGGHSGIVGPDGRYLAGPLDDEPGILYADADLERTVRTKVSQDLTGHYQRFDLFQLLVNRTDGSLAGAAGRGSRFPVSGWEAAGDTRGTPSPARDRKSVV